MRSDFKAKLIAHMLDKKGAEKGFTLIELLVVIIIIGILAAIALPSFLNQASKARQSESKTYVGSLNRTQQAYYLEKQQFAPNLNLLAVGIAQTTANYAYGVSRNGAKTDVGTSQSAYGFGLPIGNNPTAGANTTNPDTVVGNAASPIKSYIGGVSLSTPVGSTDATTLSALVEGGLAPVNGGNSAAFLAGNSANGTDYLTFTTDAAPIPRAGAGSYVVAVN
jgi:type IV pilus assembly protein PilA